MKKLLAMLLALTLVFAFAACGGNGDSQDSEGDKNESSNVNFDDSSVEDSSEDDESEDDFPVNDSSKVETSEDDSSEDDSSQEASGEDTSDETQTAPEFIENFISIGVVDTAVRATSPNAVRLTGVNTELSYGAVVVYTEQGIAAADAAEFAVAVFEYSNTAFGYVLGELYLIGEVTEDIAVPEDGFLLAMHSSQETYIEKIAKLKGTEETVFPHGLHIYEGADVTISKTDKDISIDGVFEESVWGEYQIGEISPESPDWSYAQFEAGEYYSAGKYYMTYDDTNIYLCVVVRSPYHFCPITPETAGDMWKYECIQVKASEVSPAGEYILTNYDHIINKTAHNEGVVHSYGFAANDEGETCFYESGTTFPGLAGCSRDDDSQTTVYEIAIPFESLEITPEAGVEMGLTFSVNSTSQEDFEAGGWKNITLRNGGGVIGRNDWSKIPVITLG